MITAAEAKELVKTSDATCDRLLKWLDPQVRALAEKGKYSLDVYNEELHVSGEGYSSTLKETPIMTKMLERLKLLGYRAEFVTEEQKVGRGLGWVDDEDKHYPPSYRRFIRISW